jgi:hypothetical protein
MICPGERQAYLIGEYLEGAPHYIGKFQSVDMAFQCAMDSTTVVTNRSEFNFVNACRLHVSTISALREDVGKMDNTPGAWAMILLATALVYFSQVSISHVILDVGLLDLMLLQSALNTYQACGRFGKIGATNLLLAVSNNGTQCDEYLVQMFFSLTNTEVCLVIRFVPQSADIA